MKASFSSYFKPLILTAASVTMPVERFDTTTSLFGVPVSVDAG